MAWNDLMVRVGMDSRGFTNGIMNVKRDTRGLQDGMLALSRTITDQQNKLRELGKAGQGTTTHYKDLKKEIAENKTSLRAMNTELLNTTRAQRDAGQSADGLGSAFSMIGKGAVAGALAFGAAKVLELGQSAVTTQMEFEKLGVVLTNALGSSSQAQKALKDIQLFAAETPFQVEELSESFLRLANRGMKPTMEQMRQMGDLAASQGKSFIQLTEAILDAATGEFERLKEFGIKGSKEGDRVTLMFKNQRIEVDNTADAISGAIRAMGDYEGVAGGMAAISGTLSGKLSNLRDNWSLFLNSLQGLGTTSTFVVDGLNSIVTALRQFSAGSVQIATNLNEMRLFSANGDNPFIRWQSGAEDVAEELVQVKRIGQEVLDVFAQKFTLTAPVIKKDAEGLPKPNRKMPTTIAGIEDAIKDLKDQAAAAEIGSEAYKKLSKELQTYESALKRINGHNKSQDKTAASEYRELQKELQKTREYLTFVGEANEYVGEATGMIQKKMEDIFKMGGSEALKYANLLKGELKSLVDSSRSSDGGAVAPLPTLNLLGGVESDGYKNRTKSLQDHLSAVNELKIAKRELTAEELLALEIQDIQIQSIQQLGDAMAQTMEAIGSGSMTAADAMKTFGKAALLAGLEAAKGSMIAASAEYLKTTAKLGPVGIAIGAALIGGAFALIKGAVSSSKGLKLAKGGIAYGETQATIGDNPGAKFDPEVVAPLSKLEGMLDVGGTQKLTGTFRIHGDDLVLAYDNAQRKTKAFRV